MDSSERAIAIVGLGAILPEAPDVPTFWNNVLRKRYSITDVPPERWSVADYYDPDPAAPDKTYSKIGAWVRGFEFDWKRFHIPPRVVAAMDPSQQWAVSVAAQALDDYGYPGRALDTERTAVVLGTAMGGELHYRTVQRVDLPEFTHALEGVPEFQQLPATVQAAMLDHWQSALKQGIPPITEDSMPGELPNIVSGRVANVLNLRGPNFITDAACASALAALQMACKLLAQGEADAVLTGGVDRNMGASIFVKFCKIGALSATGTRPFGAGADGFVMGEGAAAFLLKRLTDAERDGDRIYAVIRGVGGASDGKGKGITAPNPWGQQLAMQRAWESAGLDPATASLIEAHGTSTRVGDVAEVESLTAVFGGAARGAIGLGSVKSNIGHLKAGAGAAGLLKATLALSHQVLPPTLNSERPNPSIDFEHSPFRLLQDCEEWQKPGDAPRRAGVSAYGFGGTNFHVVLEENVPCALTHRRVQVAGIELPSHTAATSPAKAAAKPAPLRGILALGGRQPGDLVNELQATLQRVEQGWLPPVELPAAEMLAAPERLMIDFGSRDELLERLHKAHKASAADVPAAWKALQAQGIFRGSGPAPSKVAFLFPGQGSQYLNMGRELAARSPVVQATFEEADRVMTPLIGRPLTGYIFVDSREPDELQRAELALIQTAITQPAMLTLDVALFRLLASYGFAPDVVMGHSLGEYAALIAAGTMSFEEALEAAAARGGEMARVSLDDNGCMAAVMAPADVVEATLRGIDGYVVAANINSAKQCVIGGATRAVEAAVAAFQAQGLQAVRLPVSHAFHTRIVAPACQSLRQVLDRLHILSPRLPLVANVTGDFYPTAPEAIKDMLERQIASPVQWATGLETLYASGARAFVEVGPKKALKGFTDDVLGDRPGTWSLFTNHPKIGELPSFNQALCGLYAAGLGAALPESAPVVNVIDQPSEASMKPQTETTQPRGANGAHPAAHDEDGQTLIRALEAVLAQSRPSQTGPQVYDRHAPPAGSVVITGTGLGLPGAGKRVMDPDNALRILRGEQFIDLVPSHVRKEMLAKNITRLVKSEDGAGRFETINLEEEVIKLAGRAGAFNLAEEYGVPAKLVEALDITSQLAMAAGLEALREAGLPLVLTYKHTSTGSFLPDRWLLPEPLRDETGVIFASAFPGGNRLAEEITRCYIWQNRQEQLERLESLRQATQDAATLAEIERMQAELREALAREPYEFDRRFLFRVLSMGHSQFAEYIGARGPNTQVNAACASTAQAIGLAEDWIRLGRCRRVIVIAADDVTSNDMIGWVGAGFLAAGAGATDDRVEDAALPFDRRRHGTLMGMGACALVVESEDAARERGMRGVVELLSTELDNSAYHGTRLNVDHIAQVMETLVSSAERRFGLNRNDMAPRLVFMSHETFTPARGGSASAEVEALRRTFGPATSEIVVSNTKGFTGHPMGVGVEDVIALKILEYGIVPPVPNYKEVDPELGRLNLSRGGRYAVQYALHLAAGFGSQIAMTLTRRIPGGPNRVEDGVRYRHWLAEVSGSDGVELEVVKCILRLKAAGAPARPPAPSNWRPGTGPALRVTGSASGELLGPAALPWVAPAPAKKVEPATHSGNGHAPAVEHKAAPVSAPRPEPPARPAPAPKAESIAPPALPAQPEPRVDQTPKVPETPTVLAPSADPLAERVLAIVAEKTGYPRDMLELDLDLEADLGIDTVKQAELFVALRTEFNIARQDNMKLRDYPTLRHVIDFARKYQPQSSAGEPAAAVAAPVTVQPAPEPPPSTLPQVEQTQSISTPTAAQDDVTERVLAIVAEKTGYPRDMLELDLDLEADLR